MKLSNGVYVKEDNIKKENKLDYRKKRKELKLSQENVARKIGISLFAYQLIERGTTRNPQKETQKKLDELFGKEI